MKPTFNPYDASQTRDVSKLAPAKGSTMSADIERAAFEAAGTKLHGWGERDYERQYKMNVAGDYAYLEQRHAFALWQAARATPQAPTQAAAEGQAGARCSSCDGTGGIHDLAGEWRGECPCGAAVLRDLYAAAEREPAGPTFGAIMAAIQTLQAEPAAPLPRQAAVQETQDGPLGTSPCSACDGRGVIYQCIICGASEPRTGTCSGTHDPRSLCSFPAAPTVKASQ